MIVSHGRQHSIRPIVIGGLEIVRDRHISYEMPPYLLGWFSESRDQGQPDCLALFALNQVGHLKYLTQCSHQTYRVAIGITTPLLW